MEDALREGEDDEMVALDDFAERVNRAQREEAEEQHGLRSDWWWPKAETIEEAKKEREGRCVRRRRERKFTKRSHGSGLAWGGVGPGSSFVT